MDAEARDESLTSTTPIDRSAPAPAPSSGISFALLAHPTVQAVRFLSKIAIPWFVTRSDFGEAMLAGLILFGLQHVAVFGLDESLLSAPRVDHRLWLAMRRFQMRIGLLLASLAAAVGFALQLFPAQRLLGELIVALAPMLFVANLATLPTALLIRERRYASVFSIDLVATGAFTATLIVAAWLGAGPWSLVCAWHANAIVACVMAHRLGARLVPAMETESDEWSSARSRGAHFTGAALLGYVGERLDSVAIGFALGRALLGLYEIAQNLAQVLVNYAASLSERVLFPTLAAHHRAEGLGRAYLFALRLTIVFVLPLHVILAVLAAPIVDTLYPEHWHAAAPLLALLALAAAARCVDVVAVTALKAAGRGRTVFRLGVVRLLLCGAALGAALPHGVVACAAAVLASRAASTVVALVIASRGIDLGRERAVARIASAGRALVAWALCFVPLAQVLDRALSPHSVALLVLQPVLALVVWSLARAVLDRDALWREISLARERIDFAGLGVGR